MDDYNSRKVFSGYAAPDSKEPGAGPLSSTEKLVIVFVSSIFILCIVLGVWYCIRRRPNRQQVALIPPPPPESFIDHDQPVSSHPTQLPHSHQVDMQRNHPIKIHSTSHLGIQHVHPLLEHKEHIHRVQHSQNNMISYSTHSNRITHPTQTHGS